MCVNTSPAGHMRLKVESHLVKLPRLLSACETLTLQGWQDGRTVLVRHSNTRSSLQLLCLDHTPVMKREWSALDWGLGMGICVGFVGFCSKTLRILRSLEQYS